MSWPTTAWRSVRRADRRRCAWERSTWPSTCCDGGSSTSRTVGRRHWQGCVCSLRGRGGRADPGTQWLEPPEHGPASLHARWRRLRADESLEAVADRRVPVLTATQLRRPGRCVTRLLLSADAPAPSVPAEAAIRRHHDTLPAMVIVDRIRAAVRVTAGGLPAWGWTTDPTQIRLARTAFDTWWAEAGTPRGAGS